MARIPDGELERLKAEVSLMRLIESQGTALIRQGKDLACRCPWHCFGCDAGGSVVDFTKERYPVFKCRPAQPPATDEARTWGS